MQGKGETNDHPPGCKRPSIQLLYKLATQAASTAFISLYNPCTTQCQLHPLFSYRRDAGFITLWCKTPAYCNAARSKCFVLFSICITRKPGSQWASWIQWTRRPCDKCLFLCNIQGHMFSYDMYSTIESADWYYVTCALAISCFQSVSTNALFVTYII